MSDFLPLIAPGVIPGLYVLFLWWFTSGLLMVLFGQSARTIRLAFVGATLLFVGALVGIVLTRDRVDLLGVYTAYTCGTVIWGWLLASYYFGFITGPNQEMAQMAPSALRQSVQGNPLRRFWLALKASLYHELLVLLVVIVVAAITLPATNSMSLWILIVLWVMHSSAKLNVFFGVRNFRLEFLPDHMQFLGAFLTHRTTNPLMVLSIGLSTALVTGIYYRAIWIVADPALATGHWMVAFMLSLGILEHWLLVLPVPAAIWGWGLRSLPQSSVVEAEIQ